MPAFNASLFIAESIDSISAQTYPNWELLVIDDGSTDATPDIVHSKAAQDRRVTYLHQENGRAAKARNLGLLHARGELVAFLDSDDLWLKDKLEIMVREFRAGDQDLLFSESYMFEERFQTNGEKHANAKRMGVIAREYSGYDGLSEFLEINRIPMLTVLCKTNILKTFQFNESMALAAEYDLWLRMLIGGCKFRAIAVPLAAYRLHPCSSTAGDRLATDTVIANIYALRQSISDQRLRELIDRKLRGWLRRKLRMVVDWEQLEGFVDMLRELHLARHLWIADVLNRMSHILFRIGKKVLGKLL
ncbi:glycosyltransferase family 2 protein [Candidatus Thiodictyon syntrophicum]|nr:glycosyltransferase [Candidatus Thiodictyon syntrophicum]